MLSALDRRILDALKKDARIPVTRLARTVRASRATVQAHLDRLIRDGIIHRFTVEVEEAAIGETIRAVMLIEVEGPRARQITSELKQMLEISALHTTNGAWDLVANIEVASLRDFDRLLRQVREIEGVLNSETMILINAASY